MDEGLVRVVDLYLFELFFVFGEECLVLFVCLIGIMGRDILEDHSQAKIVAHVEHRAFGHISGAPNVNCLCVFDALQAFKAHPEFRDGRAIKIFAQPEKYIVYEHGVGDCSLENAFDDLAQLTVVAGHGQFGALSGEAFGRAVEGAVIRYVNHR